MIKIQLIYTCYFINDKQNLTKTPYLSFYSQLNMGNHGDATCRVYYCRSALMCTICRLLECPVVLV